MRRVVAGASILVFLLISSRAVSAQTSPSRTAQDYILRTWENLGKKFIDMAEDFPEEKFDSRPHPDSRSFLEEVYHVETVSRYFAARYRGEEADRGIIDAPEGKPKTRAEMVAGLKAAVTELAAVFKEKEVLQAIPLLEGIGEHYGKMVTIYRMNGLVPPTTRARQQRRR